MKQSKPCRRGFTLVELLVVIGIIAVLISILLPALSRARLAAQNIKCASNMRQLSLGMFIYANENKGVIPYDGDPRYKNSDGDRNSRSLGFWDDPGLWINVAANMIYRKSYSDMQLASPNPLLPNDSTGNSIFVCPSAASAGACSVAPAEAANGYFVMWGHNNPMPTPAIGTSMSAAILDSKGVGVKSRNVYTSYAYNSQLDSTGSVITKSKYIKQSQLRQSAITALLVEKRVNLSELPSVISTQYGSPNGNDLPSRRMARIKAGWTYFTGRHNGGGNVLMADGHVETFTMTELVLPTGYTTGNAAFDFNQPNKIIWDPFAPALP